MKETDSHGLSPLLVVSGAERALSFYDQAFGARAVAVFRSKRAGTVSHADLTIGAARFSVTEEARAWNSDAPTSLGGSPVVLQVVVDNATDALARAVRAGATVVFPLIDFCGDRMARVRDPFGHLWILSETIEDLPPEEKQRRRDAFEEGARR